MYTIKYLNIICLYGQQHVRRLGFEMSRKSCIISNCTMIIIIINGYNM